MSFIGVDLGTSGVRAGAFGVGGDELASHQVPLRLLRQGLLVELDPAEVLDAVATCIQEIASQPAVRADPPDAVSFSTQGEAVVPLSGMQPMARAPVSMDRRGQRVQRGFGNLVGGDRFQKITGQPLHPMFSVFKIAADEGSVWSGPRCRFACLDALVATTMGADLVTDWSMAARTGAFDVESRQWSTEILDAISEATGFVIDVTQLPEVAPSGSQIGEVGAVGAERYGLPPGLPIISGAHDQAAAWVGVGGQPGQVSVFSLGSSDCLALGTEGRPQGLDGTGLATYPLKGEVWVTLAGTAAGGWALGWFADLVGTTVPGLLEAISDVPAPLVVLPYFAGSGTLDNDPEARGLIAGLTLGSSRGDLARALVEAEGYELSKILDALIAHGVAPGHIVAAGGGSINQSALAVRSAAAGVPLTSFQGHASLRGAARLAGEGIGLIERLPPVVGGSPPEQLQNQKWYAGQRVAYRELYRRTRSIDLSTGPDKENTPQ